MGGGKPVILTTPGYGLGLFVYLPIYLSLYLSISLKDKHILYLLVLYNPPTSNLILEIKSNNFNIKVRDCLSFFKLVRLSKNDFLFGLLF